MPIYRFEDIQLFSRSTGHKSHIYLYTCISFCKIYTPQEPQKSQKKVHTHVELAKERVEAHTREGKSKSVGEGGREKRVRESECMRESMRARERVRERDRVSESNRAGFLNFTQMPIALATTKVSLYILAS